MELQQIYERVVNKDASAVKKLVQQAVAERVPPLEIISQYLIPAMTEVGALKPVQERSEHGQGHTKDIAGDRRAATEV